MGVMQISDGWMRDVRPQSELIQAITLTAEEEGHVCRFERKIHKLEERQAALRAAVKVDHVQLESLEKELFMLRDKDIFRRIAAGYRRPGQAAAPEKQVHSSLMPSKSQPVKTQTISQSLERA